MKMSDKNWTLLPVLLELAWLATLVATGPAKWNCRPSALSVALLLAVPNLASSPSTTGSWPTMLLSPMPVVTRMRAAWRSGDTPTTSADRTCATVRAATASALMDLRSAGPSAAAPAGPGPA